MERAGADSLALKVPVTGHDELALLGERFNRMMERIALGGWGTERTHRSWCSPKAYFHHHGLGCGP